MPCIELITAFRVFFQSGVLLAASPELPTPTVAPGQIDAQGLCFISSQDKPESSSWAVDGLLEEAIEWLLKKYEKKVKK